MSKAICPDCKRSFSNAKILAIHRTQPHMCTPIYVDPEPFPYVTLAQCDERLQKAFKEGADWADGNPLKDRVADAIEQCAKIAESYHCEIAEAIRLDKPWKKWNEK